MHKFNPHPYVDCIKCLHAYMVAKTGKDYTESYSEQKQLLAQWDSEGV